jgi:hypothetical protein
LIGSVHSVKNLTSNAKGVNEMFKIPRLVLCLVIVALMLMVVSLPVSANGVPNPNPVVATVKIEPETLNLASQGVFTAFITLPESYNIRNIDVSTIRCGVEPDVYLSGAPAEKATVAQKKLVVKFDRQNLVNIPTGNAVKLIVCGKVGSVWFEGSDTVCVK